MTITEGFLLLPITKLTAHMTMTRTKQQLSMISFGGFRMKKTPKGGGGGDSDDDDETNNNQPTT